MYNSPDMPSFDDIYSIFPDEAYAYAGSFNNLVGFVKLLASDEEDLEIEDRILLIETPEGVFIRAQTPVWCKALTKVANAREIPLSIIGIKKWQDMTRKYRAPIKSFGDESLAVWRVGF
jgi:hypothetical protein